MWMFLAIIAAYLIGSIPFSFILGKRVRGIDLRRHGSGNLGATNVFRNLGPWWGVLAMLLDMAKGVGSVLLMTFVISAWPEGRTLPLHLPPDIWRIIAGFAAALGHTLSPFVSFHGGKGVATTCGAYFVLAPYPTIVALVIFGAVAVLTRIISLASICAAVVLALSVTYFESVSAQFSKTIFCFTLVICAWVIYRHRANIRRLQAGTEKPLEQTETESAVADHQESEQR